MSHRSQRRRGGGKVWILIDHIHGPNYLEWMLQHPTALNKLIALFVQEQHEIHMHKTPELPSIKELLWSKIQGCAEIPQDSKDLLLKKLKKQPEGEHLCHLDFHPENIVVSLDGPLVIDWADAGKGNYLADVAMTSVLLKIRNPSHRHVQRRRGITGLHDGPILFRLHNRIHEDVRQGERGTAGLEGPGCGRPSGGRDPGGKGCFMAHYPCKPMIGLYVGINRPMQRT